MRTHFDIDAAAEDVWAVLGEQFGELGQFVTALESSSLEGELGVGATRVCRFNGKCLREQVTEFDREQMAIAYMSTSGNPTGIVRGANRWWIERLGERRCRVWSHAKIDLRWWMRPLAPVVRLSWRPVLRRLAEELRYKVVRGATHPRKLAAMG